MFEQYREAISIAARAGLPNEICGVIHAGQFIQLENAAPDPRNNFAFSEADALKYMTDPTTEAVVHSHPAEELPVTEEELASLEPVVPRWLNRLSPSSADMRQQLATAKPWIIAAENRTDGTWEVFDWGRHTLDLPILERPFRHGVEDCYTVIQKWWWQNKGVELLPMPREDFWWGRPGEVEPQANLYMDHFEACGATRFWPRTPGDLLPGDVFLFKLASDVYNHGGIVTGDGLVMHHPPTKLSSQAPIGPWFRRIDVWLRKESP